MARSKPTIIYKKKDESKSLEILKKLCPSKNPQNIMGFSKFFGCGTTIIIFMILIIICGKL